MPVASDLHIDALMTSFAIAYRNNEFVGEALFPLVPVTKKSDKFAILDPDKQQQRVINTERQPRTRAKSVDWANSTDNYSCVEYAVNSPVDDSERANADNPLDPDRAATAAALDAILLDREDRIAVKATTAANYSASNTVTLAGVNQWSDATSNPKADVDTARDELRKDVAKLPNRAIIPFAVLNKLAVVTKVLDAVKYTNLGVASISLLEQYLQLPAGAIVVAMAVKNTAKEGQLASISDVWGKDVVLAYVDPAAGLWGMTFGKTFQWQALQVRTWRDEGARTDYYEPMAAYDEKIVAKDAGYLIKAAIA